MNELEVKERAHTVHCSSTEISSAYAWVQIFVNGSQSNGYKTDSYWVRAVRKIKK